jgi:hypothetical protein
MSSQYCSPMAFAIFAYMHMQMHHFRLCDTGYVFPSSYVRARLIDVISSSIQTLSCSFNPAPICINNNTTLNWLFWDMCFIAFHTTLRIISFKLYLAYCYIFQMRQTKFARYMKFLQCFAHNSFIHFFFLFFALCTKILSIYAGYIQIYMDILRKKSFWNKFFFLLYYKCWHFNLFIFFYEIAYSNTKISSCEVSI